MLEKSSIESKSKAEIPYRKIKELGSGSFGIIYLVEHVHEKTFWVSKEIPLEKLEVTLKRKIQSSSSFKKQNYWR
jgi:serine/threonine protein kinase